MVVCLPFRGLVFYFQTGTTPRIFFYTCKGKVQWFTWATHSSIESCELCDPLVGCLWRVRYILPFLLEILLFIHKLSDFGMLIFFGLVFVFFLHHISTSLSCAWCDPWSRWKPQLTTPHLLGWASRNSPRMVLVTFPMLGLPVDGWIHRDVTSCYWGLSTHIYHHFRNPPKSTYDVHLCACT